MKKFLVLILFVWLLASVAAKKSSKKVNELLSKAKVVKVQDELPGFKTSVSQNGLDYVADVGLKILQKVVADIHVKDLKGDADTPVGHVDWDLTEIKIKSFKIGKHELKIDPATGLHVALSDAEAAVTLNWHYQKVAWPHISDSGSADISTVGASATVNLAVKTEKERPHVDVSSDGFNIGDLDITLHGGASWLYNFFIHVLKGTIEDAINKALTDAITKNIDGGVNKALSTLPIEVHVNNQAEIDFPLVSDPFFAPAYLTISQLGEFYEIGNHVECPSPRVSLPNQVTGNMVNMMISDFVVNSAGFTFFNLGSLHVLVTNKDVPSWSPIQLNTSSFQYILPGLYQKFPNQLMELKIYSTQPPTASFATSGSTITANGNCEVLVVNSDQNSTSNAFTLSGYVSADGQALLDGTTIYGNLTFLKANVSVSSSNIGPFNVNVLDSLINLFLSQGLIPAINTVLRTGFPLPTVDGITFVNPSLIWNEGYLTVATDINYNPPELEKFRNVLPL